MKLKAVLALLLLTTAFAESLSTASSSPGLVEVKPLVVESPLPNGGGNNKLSEEDLPPLVPLNGGNQLEEAKNNKLNEGELPPSWELNGKNVLEEARKEGKVVVLALWKASCPYCQSEAAKLYQWYQLLKDYKDSFKVIVINQIGDEEALLSMDRLSRKNFHLYQDDVSTNVWDQMKGEKDSLYIFNQNGLLVKQFHGKNASMGQKNLKCEDVNKNEVIKQLLKELAPLSKDTDKCDDGNFIKYKRVIKDILKRNKSNKIKKKNGRGENGAKNKNKQNKLKRKNRKNKNKKDRKGKKKNKGTKKKNKRKNRKKNKGEKRKRKERKRKRKQQRKNKKNKISEKLWF